MTANKKNTFEDALAKLEAAAESLKKEDVTLEEALRHFEAGIAQYDACSAILKDAKQKIETYRK